MIEATENRADVGEALAKAQGCLARYSPDGTKGVGPNWQVPWGREEYLTDGSTVTIDDEHFRGSIEYPYTKVAEGFSPVMLPYHLQKKSSRQRSRTRSNASVYLKV